MTVLRVIWPYLSIWLTEISLKKSSKMEFRLIDLRSLGPPSQKLWTNQISAEFLVKYVILGGQNWALKDQPGQKRVTSPPKNHNKVHYNWKQCIFDEKWTIGVIVLHHPPEMWDTMFNLVQSVFNQFGAARAVYGQIWLIWPNIIDKCNAMMLWLILVKITFNLEEVLKKRYLYWERSLQLPQ